MASQLTRRDPFREFFGELERVLGAPAFPATSVPQRWTPTADVVESDDEIVITAELPGVKDEDIEITVEDGGLRISGDRAFTHEARDDHAYRLERSYGAFERHFPLPPGIRKDDITASVVYGVLKITVPKAVDAGRRRVPVTPGA